MVFSRGKALRSSSTKAEDMEERRRDAAQQKQRRISFLLKQHLQLDSFVWTSDHTFRVGRRCMSGALPALQLAAPAFLRRKSTPKRRKDRRTSRSRFSQFCAMHIVVKIKKQNKTTAFASERGQVVTSITSDRHAPFGKFLRRYGRGVIYIRT